jgi:hypothetical protein
VEKIYDRVTHTTDNYNTEHALCIPHRLRTPTNNILTLLAIPRKYGGANASHSYVTCIRPTLFLAQSVIGFLMLKIFVPTVLYSYFSSLLTCCLSSKLVTVKHATQIFASPCEQDLLYVSSNIKPFIRRIKSNLPFPGIIRSSPYSPR